MFPILTRMISSILVERLCLLKRVYYHKTRSVSVYVMLTNVYVILYRY